MIEPKTTSLAEVLLSDIDVSESNKLFRSEDDFTLEALQELINSIRENGLAQPILLRPGKKPGRYTLVAGERRFHACEFIQVAIKSRDKIPAYIRELTEEQAFDMQLTENIERKDIHPMKEARAYKILHDEKKWTTAEIALRFSKGETYILQRLKLNALIPEAAKDFISNAMSLGHAVVLARLQPEAQKEVIQHSAEVSRGKDKTVYYNTVKDLEDYIQSHIMHDLKEASFDTTSVDLVPKAGSCLTCAKRSGANPLLFADIKEKDRCFDKSCYQIKRQAALFLTVKEMVENKPDTIYLVDGWAQRNKDKVSDGIAKLLSDNGIKVLSDNDYQSFGYGDTNKKVRGFMLNGDYSGRLKEVFIKGKSSKENGAKSDKPNEMSAADKKDAIGRIKERTKRLAELDEEKIFARTIELIQTHKNIDERTPKVIAPSERGLVALMLYNAADYSVKDDLKKHFKLKAKVTEQVTQLKALTDRELLHMAVRICVNRYSSPYHHDQEEGFLLREVAELWNIPIADLVKEQKDIRIKREERAKARIADLSKPEPKPKAGLKDLLKKKPAKKVKATA